MSPRRRALSKGPLDLDLLPICSTVEAGGRLAIAGVDLVGLAEEIGTPVFVYDEEHLRARCREAVAAWGDGVAYATKAFLCRAMATAGPRGGHVTSTWRRAARRGWRQRRACPPTA